jgi:hypothetical protein
MLLPSLPLARTPPRTPLDDAMPLEYPSEWKFEPPAITIPVPAHQAVLALIEQIAAGQSAYLVFQTVKEHFGGMGASASASWAQTDMAREMVGLLEDGVGYVARLWSALEELRERDVPIPEARVLNKILHSHEIPLVVEPPSLRLRGADAVVVTPANGAPPPPRPDRFVLGERIGAGGFGTVYHATRATSVAPFAYAMKVLDPSPFQSDPIKAAARFARESTIMSRLQHRAIISVIETGMLDAHRPYILMPRIVGTTLRATPMPVEQIIWTFQEVLRGLEYLHGQHVIHRDLKPSNIIVRTSDQQPLILDFGCAYLFDDEPEKTLTTTLVGSAPYIPPEVHANPTMRDPRQDVYACGIMLYEMLRGHRPVPDDYAPLTAMLESLAPFDRLVQDAIAPAPRRIPSARVFLDRLTVLAPSVS